MGAFVPFNRPGSSADGGYMGGAEALPFAVLIFVTGTLVVVNIWAVVDARWAADSAAREATRRFVEADIDDPAGTPEALAIEAGYQALEAHGRDRARGHVELGELAAPRAATSTPAPASAHFVRCARATFTATYTVPTLSLPLLGGFGDGIDVTGRHTALVDPFRDGVPGDVETC